jgi:hypothetical protein
MSFVKGNVVGRHSDTAEACIRSQAGVCEICGVAGTGLSPVTSVLPCHYHCNNAAYSSYVLICPFQKDKQAKVGEF